MSVSLTPKEAKARHINGEPCWAVFTDIDSKLRLGTRYKVFLDTTGKEVGRRIYLEPPQNDAPLQPLEVKRLISRILDHLGLDE